MGEVYEDDIAALQRTLREKIKELEESKERYNTLSQVSPVGMFRLDSEGKCVYVNERWSELIGLTYKESLGYGWLKCLQNDKLETKCIEMIKAGKDFQFECKIQKSDNKSVWVLMRAKYVNTVVDCGFMGTVTNITTKKEILPELLKLKKSLN